MFCREVRHKQTHKQTRQFELLRGATMEIESVVQNDTGCFPGYVIKGDLWRGDFGVQAWMVTWNQFCQYLREGQRRNMWKSQKMGTQFVISEGCGWWLVNKGKAYSSLATHKLSTDSPSPPKLKSQWREFGVRCAALDLLTLAGGSGLYNVKAPIGIIWVEGGENVVPEKNRRILFPKWKENGWCSKGDSFLTPGSAVSRKFDLPWCLLR